MRVGGGSTGPAAIMPPAPRADRYDVELHTCQAGDTWEKLSREKYGNEDAAAALREFNRNNERAEGLIRSEGTMAPGLKVYIPPLRILKGYGLNLGPAAAKPAAGAGSTAPPPLPGK
jgi:hypothetical protein